MKRFNKSAALWSALFAISIAVTGCGSNNSGTATTNGGVVNGNLTSYNGGVVGVPGGGAQITFTGYNNYASTVYIDGGNVNGSNGTCAQAYCFCDLFPVYNSIDYFSPRNYTGQSYSGAYPSCWQFMNQYHSTSYYPQSSGTGTVMVGAGNVVNTGYGTTYMATSAVDPGTSLTLMVTPTGEVNHANVVGALTISAYSLQRYFGGSTPSITGLSYSFNIDASGNRKITGGVLISYGNGVMFLAM